MIRYFVKAGYDYSFPVDGKQTYFPAGSELPEAVFLKHKPQHVDAIRVEDLAAAAFYDVKQFSSNTAFELAMSHEVTADELDAVGRGGSKNRFKKVDVELAIQNRTIVETESSDETDDDGKDV